MQASSQSLLDQTTEALKGIMIPAQPELISEVLSAIPDIDAISHIIQRDPALSASILRLVDRPFSKRPQLSIEYAVKTLGIGRVTMAINASLLHRASRAELDSEALRGYWETSQKVAEISMLIAQRLNLRLADEAYCVGIFHHIGMPLLWQKEPNYFDLIKGFGGQRLIERENELYGKDHASVGYYIASSIQLGSSICDAIRYHHSCLEVLHHPKMYNKTTLTLLSILKLAEHISCESERLCSDFHPAEWEEISGDVLSCLGLIYWECEEFVDSILNTPVPRKNNIPQKIIH
ncbi:MAG: hypothetical protein COA42_19765 [Alteromonadaceae bacterium]|nr:MAG: hypothetical protein COA42_19765 [Alteromonadaceae bacterium]